MRRTGTIRGAKSLQGYGRSTGPLHHLGPLVLSTERIIRIPDRYERCDEAHIIDVPMWSGRTPTVVRHTRAHAARAKGATNIDIESGPHVERPKPSDLYQMVSRGC